MPTSPKQGSPEFPLKQLPPFLRGLLHSGRRGNVDWAKEKAKITVTLGAITPNHRLNRDGSDAFVWTYELNVINNSDFAVQLLYRRWKIDDSSYTELVGKNLNNTQALTMWGERPVVAPGDTFTCIPAIAFSKDQAFLTGEIVAQFPGQQETFDIPVLGPRKAEKINFGGKNLTKFNNPIYINELGELGRVSVAGASKLISLLSEFSKKVKLNSWELFDFSELPDIESADIFVIVSYLIVISRIDPNKERIFDLTPIMPAGMGIQLCANDFYFMSRKREEPLAEALDVTAVVSITKVILPPEIQGASGALPLDVKSEVFKNALTQLSAEDRAFVAELALPEHADIFRAIQSAKEEFVARRHAFSKPPIPKLSEEQISAIKARAKAKPWRKRKFHKADPFRWVEENYEEWIGKGLQQSHLMADRLLYGAFTQKVKRDGLPDDLDVPTDSDVVMRQIGDPSKQLRALIARNLQAATQRLIRTLAI